MSAIIAEDGDDVGAHGAGAGFVVVFADAIGEGEGDVARLDVVDAEVVPGGLAVVAALVVLSLDGAAEGGGGGGLDLAEGGVFEVGVEGDVGGRGGLREGEGGEGEENDEAEGGCRHGEECYRSCGRNKTGCGAFQAS